MNASEHINELAGALALANLELRNPPFDSANSAFSTGQRVAHYASLASVRDTITPVLAKYGLAVVQLVGACEAGVQCETILTHKSGQWISGICQMPVTPTGKQERITAQNYGSATTYARRYSLMAIVNVVGDYDDDDANGASDQKPNTEEQERTELKLMLARISTAADVGALHSAWREAVGWMRDRPQFAEKLTAAKDARKDFFNNNTQQEAA